MAKNLLNNFLRLVLAAVLSSSPLLSASATILWYGGEDTSVTFIGTAAVNTSNYTWRTAYARASLAGNNSTTVADPPANRFATPTFTAGSTVWIHGEVYSGTIAGTSNEQALIVRSPDGVSRIVVRQTGTDGTLKVSKRNAAGTITDLATASGTFPAVTSGAPWQFDMEIIYSGTCTINMWINTTSVIAYSGACETDAATTLNQVGFAAVNNTAGGCNTTNGTCWSELIVADEDTRSMALATLTLQGAGATQAWTPNTLANVNKATISDTTFVATSSSGQISEWTAPTSAPAGIWGVKSVSIEARLEVNTTGPQNGEFIAHVAGSDYTNPSSCSIASLTNSFANYRCQMDVSPATSTTWGISEVFNSGASQYSFGVESQP